MSNTLTPPQLSEAAPQIPADYQRGFDDPTAEQHLIEAQAGTHTNQSEEAWQPEPIVTPIAEGAAPSTPTSHEPSGGFFGGYRYKGSHRARRDQPSSHDRYTLTPGDQDLRAVLHEVREDAYSAVLEQAGDAGESERVTEVRARAAAQKAVSEYYADVQDYRGGHRSSQPRVGGQHEDPTFAQKAVRWLTYSPEEVAARARQKQDKRDLKRPAKPMNARMETAVPELVHTTPSRVRPSRAERRYMQAVGAVDDGDFEAGRATARGESRALYLPLAATAEQQEVDLVINGARTPEEVFNTMYGDRVVGGSTIYGGKVLSENPGLRRKITEAGTTNQDSVGPVERGIAQHFAERMTIVTDLESQVTDTRVPRAGVIEAALYPGVKFEDLTEEQQLVVKTVQERLAELRESKLRPGETLDARVKPDRTGGGVREAWRKTKESVRNAKEKAQRAAGIVALHGAMWTDAALMIVQPEYTPKPRSAAAEEKPVHHAAGAWDTRSKLMPPSVEPVRIYSPGELAGMASRWAFVRAQMIANGLVRPLEYRTSGRHEALEHHMRYGRLIGAAAALATAVAVKYGWDAANDITHGHTDINNFISSIVESQGIDKR